MPEASQAASRSQNGNEPDSHEAPPNSQASEPQNSNQHESDENADSVRDFQKAQNLPHGRHLIGPGSRVFAAWAHSAVM